MMMFGKIATKSIARQFSWFMELAWNMSALDKYSCVDEDEDDKRAEPYDPRVMCRTSVLSSGVGKSAYS